MQPLTLVCNLQRFVQMLDDNDVDVAIYPVHVQDPPVLSMSSTPGFGETPYLYTDLKP